MSYTPEFYLKNKDRLKATQKRYYEKNKDKLIQRQIDYYKANSEDILAKKKITSKVKKYCDVCKSESLKDNFTKHVLTNKHIRNLAKNKDNDEREHDDM